MEAGLKVKEFEGRGRRVGDERILVLQLWDGSLGEGSGFWRQLPVVTYGLFLGVDEELYRILR